MASELSQESLVGSAVNSFRGSLDAIVYKAGTSA